MLQNTELKQRFVRIEHDIDEAEIGCCTNTNLPQNFKDAVTQWKKHASHAKEILESKDEKKIIRCIEDLEEIGGRTELALQSITGVDARLKDSVVHAHNELAELKRKMH